MKTQQPEIFPHDECSLDHIRNSFAAARQAMQVVREALAVSEDTMQAAITSLISVHKELLDMQQKEIFEEEDSQ